TGPRKGKKDSEHRRQNSESWPQPFPEQVPSRASKGSREQKPRGVLARLVVCLFQGSLPRSGSGESIHHRNTHRSRRPCVCSCAHSQSGMRSSAINWSTSRRGRTKAHSAPLTNTSGTRALVL